jgi:hypothetical protein
MNNAASGIYHPRNPTDSPLWNVLNNHYDDFEKHYEEKYEKKYGYFRPVIKKVVEEYLKCGDLKEGFARVRCHACGHEYLLAFSCKGRWFCPSCHAKKVIQFADMVKANILYPIPHRQYVFSIPIILRLFFKYDRKLLTKLCRCAYESLLEFLHTAIGLADGVPGVVMTIHTFGDYMEKFHPHLHALVSDGLFTNTGVFYVMPKVDLEPLEEIFRAKVLKMLKAEGKIDNALISNLMSWKHTGFSVHNGVKIAKDDDIGKENVAQYIIRNTFSLTKLNYVDETGTVIYHAKMTCGKNKKNFVVYKAEDFIAAICQHIPEKFFQMVRYFGYYSNKSRGLRRKKGILRPGDVKLPVTAVDIDIIDISEYNPARVPSKTWRECIKKIWEVDPLLCPRCNGSMRIISFITEDFVIKQILKHLGLWQQKFARSPPSPPKTGELVYVPCYDDWPIYEEHYITVN